MNNRHYKSLLAAAILSSFTQTAFADTLAPIDADQDTWTNGSGAGSGSNYGTQSTLRIDTGKMRAFIQFTIAGIPTGHTVDSAILTLTSQGNNSGNIPDTFVAAVTNAPLWDQTTLTDLNDDALLAATGDAIASTTDIAVGATADFDIAAAINANGTYTFMINIADADARATKYYSSEASESFRPKLTITTSAAPDNTVPVISVPADITVAAIDDSGTPDTNIDIATFLTAAMANDAVDGAVDVTYVAPTVFPLGETTVTFEASDTNANTATMEAKITVTDQTAPIITLVGDNAPTLSTGDSYSEQGATALDNVEGDISVDIIVSGDSVNTTTPGTYTVTYNLTDSAGNIANEITRRVTVQDASVPVVNAPANITVAATDQHGTAKANSDISTFLTAATANDDVDGTVTVSHNALALDNFPIGDTIVTFSAKDSSDNIGTSQATVTIADQTSPIITLVGGSAITVNLDEPYVDLGSTAVDNVDGDISDLVVVGGDTVDTSKGGIYTITYNIIDVAGNAALERTRRITIQDVAAPIVSPPENITVAATDDLGTADSDTSIIAFLAAATANDTIDGDVNVTHNAPAIFPIGTTIVTFSAIDSDSKTGASQATVTITDQTAPVITLTGESSISLFRDQDYNEAGYSAEDNVDGDMSANVVVGGETVDTTTLGTYTVTYNLTDSAGNDAAQLTREINIIIDPDSDSAIDTDGDGISNDKDTDDDGDGVPDIYDQLPLNRFETLDTDLDGIGDNSDPDIDGDNVRNDVDSYPLDASQSKDTTAPIFSDETPIVVINATGALTDISESISVTATDDLDGEIAAIIDGETSLTSGAHNVTVSATDTAGNTASQTVTLHITPQLLLSKDEEVAAGSSKSLVVKLSGPAATYPVLVDYSLSGDAVSHTSGTLNFTSSTSEQTVTVNLLTDASVDETAILTIDAAENVQLPATNNITLTVIESNQAPQLALTQYQSGKEVSVIDVNAGPVTVTAAVSDINPKDLHDINWYSANDVLPGVVGADSLSFTFDPATLTAGSYQLTVKASENNTDDNFTVSVETDVVIIVDVPQLSNDNDSDNDGIADSEEGFGDSDGDGIPDHLDNNSNTSQLPLASGEQPLQTLNGLQLAVGRVALSANALATSSASISIEDLAELFLDDTYDEYLPLAGTELINFIVKGVSVGESAPIVYPLPSNATITAETVYRKYTPANGWVDFVSDSYNRISSAIKNEAGVCPPPLNASYTEGLTAGNNCLQLQIADGGVYDADGMINGQIEDPGVLAEAYNYIEWSSDSIELPATDVNENISVNLTGYLTAYVGDADVSTITFAKDKGPAWLTVNESGTLSADLSNVASGDYSATVSFTDTKAQTAQTEVKVSVVFNSAPTLAEVELPAASRNEEYSASIAEQITDADGDNYTVSKVGGPYWLKVSETGELSGTPLKANIGDNNITIELTDNKGATNEVTLTLAVNDSNVRASDGGSFSAVFLAIIALVSLRRKPQK